MLRWFERHQVYHPDRAMVTTGSELGRPFEDVWFKTVDGIELNAWFFPATKNSARSRQVALICHGNAGNISTRLSLCAALLETGINVFLFDYRGYGRSKGRPSEEGTYLDAEAAGDWLRTKGFAENGIIAFGESLGGGIASELAVRRPLGGLVLESTFSCAVDLGCELFPWLPVRRISTIKYDTCSKLPRIKIPVLIIHSRGDAMIGFHHAERNFAAANEPKLLCEVVGTHNEPLTDRIKFREGMEAFLQLIEKTGRVAFNPERGCGEAQPQRFRSV